MIKIDATTGVLDTTFSQNPGFTWGTGATGGGSFFPYFDSISNTLLVGTDTIGSGNMYNG